MNSLFSTLMAFIILFQPLMPRLDSPGNLTLDQVSKSFDVYFHPDGGLQVGDLVSLDVFSLQGQDESGQNIKAELVSPIKSSLGSAAFGQLMDGRWRATFQWVWDTRGLSPGIYVVQFTTDKGETWQNWITLSAYQTVNPPPHWAEADIACCRVHYITGTAAERDLSKLEIIAQAEADDAAMKMHSSLPGPVDIELMPRVLGQGGFASDEIYISYLDKNYALIDFGEVLHHEFIHIIDHSLGNEHIPLFFVEGLAVYLTGGHYKPEPLLFKAAGLLDTGQFIDLSYLMDHFYPSQHEIGYLEAGALVSYLVETYGWDSFTSFYRNIKPEKTESDSCAIDRSLKENFGLSLKEMEDRFQSRLLSIPAIADLEQDLELTIALYDQIRNYQKLLDPSAYFLQVWLLDGSQVRAKGITADVLRHPGMPINIQIEIEFIQAGQFWKSGAYIQAWRSIPAVP